MRTTPPDSSFTPEVAVRWMSVRTIVTILWYIEGMITFKNTRTTAELEQILTLQQQNLPTVLSDEVQQSQGFLTVQHNLPLLQRIGGAHGHAVAVNRQRVVGYALVMLPAFRDEIAVLQPMFTRLGQLSYREQPVPDYRYLVMGQICVAYEYRGRGVFDGLYRQLKDSTAIAFDLIITEVATRNRRSWRAHERIGFQTLETYTADTGEQWAVLLWDFR